MSFGVKCMRDSETFYNAISRPFGIAQIYRDISLPSAAKVCGWGWDEEEPFTLFERARVGLLLRNSILQSASQFSDRFLLANTTW